MDEEFFIIRCVYIVSYSIIFINVFYIFFMCNFYLEHCSFVLAVQFLRTICRVNMVCFVKGEVYETE